VQVLLKQSVEHLGQTGEMVEVKPGYARNYLVPRGCAIVVDKKNRRSIEKEIEKYKALEEKQLVKLRSQASALAEANCTVAVQADENDKLYGSVTPEEISRSLKIAGFDVPPKAVRIPKAIRAIGVFEVVVNLGNGVNADLKVWVVKE
jgi:large subunit ribosomal protein L9